MNQILILGLAGGSVVKKLIDEIKFKGKITGIEIDQQIIEILNNYFQFNEIKKLKIIIEDAFQFILKTTKKYNLMIIDIFEDDEMPDFLYNKLFSDCISILLNIN